MNICVKLFLLCPIVEMDLSDISKNFFSLKNLAIPIKSEPVKYENLIETNLF